MSSPLAQLNAYIRSVSPGAKDGGHELASARRFREAWSLLQAENKLDLASLRRPANAGPLNSHALVLESLERVHALSPAYLRRLLAQVDTLQWLEQASLRPRAPAAPAPSPPAPKRRPRRAPAPGAAATAPRSETAPADPAQPAPAQ